MVSEEYCAVLLMNRDDQDAALITQYITAVDSNIDVHWEKDCPAVLNYLQDKLASSVSDMYLRPRLIILCIASLSSDVVETLEFIKNSGDLKKVPVLVFGESANSEDIKKSYDLKINSYLLRPGNDNEFSNMLKEVSEYWLKWNQLPS